MIAVLGLLIMAALPAPAADSAVVAGIVWETVGSRVHSQGEEAEIQHVRLPIGGIPQDVTTCRVLTLPLGRLHGPVTAMVELISGGGRSVLMPVSMQVRTFGSVGTVRIKLGRHAPLREGVLSFRRMETTGLHDGYVSEFAGVVGMRTRRIVSEGEVLFTTMCEKEPVVREGDEVSLVSRFNGVKVAVPAVARQDGVPGALIAVRPAGKHENVGVVVIDAHTVELRVR